MSTEKPGKPATHITAHGLFMQYAPTFNFELGADEILALALEKGFVSKIEGDDTRYLINQDYMADLVFARVDDDE